MLSASCVDSPPGFHPGTSRFISGCSVQLSYRRMGDEERSASFPAKGASLAAFYLGSSIRAAALPGVEEAPRDGE